MTFRLIKFSETIRVLLTFALFLLFVGKNTCNSQSNEENASQNLGNLSGLIFTEGNRVNFIDSNGQMFMEVATSAEPTNAIYSCTRDTFYWIKKSSKIQSFKLLSLQSNSSLIFNDKPSVLKGIALDYVSDKLYIGNNAFHTIEVVDLKTGYRGIVRSEAIPAINDIAVDSKEGYLFVLGEYQLGRMDLDGLNYKLFNLKLPDDKNTTHPGEYPNTNSIQLDSTAKRVYWVNEMNGTTRILSWNFDGKDQKLHLKYKLDQGQSAEPIHGLEESSPEFPDPSYWVDPSREVKRPVRGSLMAFLQDTLFLIDYNQGAIRRVNLNNPNNSTVIYKGKSKKISSISSFDCLSFEHPQTPTPCDTDNGGCQQLCILSRSNETNSRCFCKVGYELAKDGKSCILPTKFIAFTQGKHLRGINLRKDTHQYIDVLNPSKRSPGENTFLDVDTQKGMIYYQSRPKDNFIDISLPEGKRLISKKNSKIGLDYEEKQFYNKSGLSNGNLRVDILNEGKEVNLLPDFMAKEATDIAFDWASKNLYYFTHYYGWKDRTLSVLNSKNPTYSKILAKSSWFEYGLAVHPNKGYVYFVEAEDTWDPASRIFRIHTDGSDSTKLIKGRSLIRGITIDYEEDKIYWTEDEPRPKDSSIPPLKSIIYCSNLDGKEISKIDAILWHPSAMAIQGDGIYAVNSDGHALVRVPRKGGPSQLLVQAPDLWGLRIFDPSIQKIRKDHPCANTSNTDKKSCEKFCFAVPKTKRATSLKRVCGCPYGEKLASNGRSCVGNSRKEPPLVPCRSYIRHCVNSHDQETALMVPFAYKIWMGDTLDV